MSEMWTWILAGVLLWVVVPLPLALLVGRIIRAGSAAQPAPDAMPDAAPAAPAPLPKRIVIRHPSRAGSPTRLP